MRITQRALNRTLLARQLLLERRNLSPLAVIEHLAGLQAQQARPPFIGLWSRLAGFEPEELRLLIRERQVVRATTMRGTLHLLSRRDFLTFRPLLQPALANAVRSALGPWPTSPDLPALLAEGRRLLMERPHSIAEVRAMVRHQFPDADEQAMGLALRTYLPLVVIPRKHAWAYRADSHFALAEAWLGEPLSTNPDAGELIRRYLAAFGPASLRDVAAWAGLAISALRTGLTALGSQLEVLQNEEGTELLDLPGAPLVAEDVPAPARLVADFDNLVLSHADRRRIIADEHRRIVITKNGMVLPTILVDGFVAGTWSVKQLADTVTLTISPFAALTPTTCDELAAEAESLMDFLYPGTSARKLAFNT